MAWLDRPRVGLQILKDGTELELTLTTWHQKSSERIWLVLGLTPSHTEGAQELLYLAYCDFFIAPEDIGLHALGISEVIHLHYRPKSDETNEVILWNHVERHDERLLQCIELLRIRRN